MPIDAESLYNELRKNFPDAEIKIEDLAGDNDHYSLQIIAKEFKDKSLIEQHKMVNNALKFCLGTSLHALKINTKSSL
jgi:stress-induced morphogen